VRDSTVKGQRSIRIVIMVSLRFVLLAAVMVGIALAAPAEEKSDKTEASEKKTSSAAEEKGVAAVDNNCQHFLVKIHGIF